MAELLSASHFQLCDTRGSSSLRCLKRETNAWREGGRSPLSSLLSPLRCDAEEARTAEAAAAELTGNGAQVEVVPYDLLELVVQRALLKLQTEVVAQVRIQHFTCNNKGRKEVSECITPLRWIKRYLSGDLSAICWPSHALSCTAVRITVTVLQRAPITHTFPSACARFCKMKRTARSCPDAWV